MKQCYNKNHPDWVYAVEKLGKDKALFIYDKLGDLPTKEQVNYLSSTKPLFTSIQDVIDEEDYKNWHNNQSENLISSILLELSGFNKPLDREPITPEEALKVWEEAFKASLVGSPPKNISELENLVDREARQEWERIQLEAYNDDKYEFQNTIERQNKPFERSRHIIDKWKSINNIVYTVQDAIDRNESIYHGMGAYNSSFGIYLKGLLSDIPITNSFGDIGYVVSAYTTNDIEPQHLANIRLKILPMDGDILWASPVDVWSGMNDIGIQYTKYPNLKNITKVVPSVGEAIDKRPDGKHNELGVRLRLNNFYIEYDDNVSDSLKKQIDEINSKLSLYKDNNSFSTTRGINSNPSLYNKKTIIDKLIEDFDPEMKDTMAEKFARLDNDEFDSMVKQAGYSKIGKYWTASTVNNVARKPAEETLSEDSVKYSLKLVDTLNTISRNKFESSKLQGWLNDLQKAGVSKEQIEIFKQSAKDGMSKNDIIIDILSKYNFVVESKISKGLELKPNHNDDSFYYNNSYYNFVRNLDQEDEYLKDGQSITFEEYNKARNKAQLYNTNVPSQYYSNMTVPGGTNYTENEISTPAIVPSIKGHAQFSTDNGIGWFRSDEQLLGGKEKYIDETIPENERYIADWIAQDHLLSTRETIGGSKTKTRRILEIQSDLFQKGRNRKGSYIKKTDIGLYGVYGKENNELLNSFSKEEDALKYISISNLQLSSEVKQDDFLQLLNKDNNWVTFFVKTILQDSAKKGYEKVLFPTGETAAKVEGHQTIADEIKSVDKSIELLIARKLFVDNNGTEYYQRLNSNNEIKYSAKDNEGNLYDMSKEIWTEKIIPLFDDEIKNLQKHRSELKSQGIEKLKPIEAFYTNTITNILKKIGKFESIIDEYGNTWNEVKVDKNRDLSPIILRKPFSTTWQEVLYGISDSITIEDVEKLLLGYRGAISSKKHEGSIFIKAMSPETPNYIAIVDDLIQKIDGFYPGLINKEFLKEASDKVGRGVWKINIDPEAFRRIKERYNDNDYIQGQLFKRDPRAEMRQLIAEDRENIRDFFSTAREIDNASKYLTELVTFSVNMSQEHKDIINLILNSNEYIPNINIKQINENEVGRYFNLKEDPYIGESFGIYNLEDNTIYIIKNRILHSNNPESMLLCTVSHEILHGITLSLINKYYKKETLSEKELEYVKNIEGIYKKAKKLTKNPDHNAWTSLIEFVADGLSDQKIIDELKTMVDTNKDKSLWDIIKEFFLKLLGVTYTTGSYYHELFSATTDIIHSARTAPSAVDSIHARKIADNTFINKDNPRHKEIIEALSKIEEGYKNQPKRFHGPTSIMRSLKLGGLPDSMLTADAKTEMKKNTGPGTSIHFHIQKSLHSVVEEADLKYNLTDEAKKDLEVILSTFKKPGSTILSEVTVVDYNTGIMGIIDLVIIDADNKVHIFDFKTKKSGFGNFDKRFSAKLGEPEYIAISEFEKAQTQLTVYSDLWRICTNTKVTSMNVIPLKSTIDEENKTISKVELDRSFDGKDLIHIPESRTWLEIIYNRGDDSFNKANERDVLNIQDELEALKEIDKQEKDKIKMLASQINVPPHLKHIVETEFDIYNRVIKSIQNKVELESKRNTKSELLARQLAVLKHMKDLGNKDIDEALRYAVYSSERFISRAKKELDTLQESNSKIDSKTLFRINQTVIAFDDLDGYLTVLSQKFGKEGPKTDKDKKLVSDLQNVINMKNEVKLKYRNLGLDILSDFLYPVYTKFKAELKAKYKQEFRQLKREGKITDSNLTEQEYVDQKLTLEEEDIETKAKMAIRAELKKGGRDIGILTMWLDSPLDSRDAILGAFTKKFAMLDSKAVIEIERQRLIALQDLSKPGVREYMSEFGNDFQKAFNFMLERNRKTGELTGSIVTHFPSDLWKEYNIMIRASEDLDDTTDPSNGEYVSTRSKIRKSWKEKYMPLDKEAFNAAYLDYIEDALKDGRLNSDEYEKLRTNFLMIRQGITLDDMYNSGTLTNNAYELAINWFSKNSFKYRNPSKEYHNSQWDVLSKILENPDDPRSILYNMIIRMQEAADDLLPINSRLRTRLPGVVKQKYERVAAGQNLFEIIKRSIGKSLTVQVDDTNRVHTDIVDAKGETKYFVPANFTGRVIKKITDEEGRILEVFDDKEQSFNLPAIYFGFLASSIDFSWKNELMPTMEMFKDTLRQRKLSQTRGGKVIYKASKLFGSDQTKENELELEGGNLAKQYEAWMKYALYGQSDKDLGTIPGTNIDVSKLMGVLGRFTSLNLLAVNVLAGISNVALGQTIQAIEAFAGQYMTPSNYTKGQMFYHKNFMGIVGDIESHKPQNIVSLILRQFNVLHDPRVKNLTKTRFQEFMQRDTLFFTNHVGEHWMQVPFLLGMLADVKAYNKKGELIGNILELYKVVDGELVIDPEVEFDEVKSKWTADDRAIFEHRVNRILGRMHGLYGHLDRVMIQQNAITAMAYMFRKFIVPGFRRRWGAKNYEEGMEDYTEGNYITTINFIGRLFKNIKQHKAIMMTKEWELLDDGEKANIYRAMGEVVAFILSYILISVALGLRDDDDTENRMLGLISYQALRLRSELLFFLSPTAAMQILRSPAPGVSIFESGGKLVTQLFGPGWHEYEQGPWKDHLKIEKSLVDMTIGVKQFYKLRDINTIVDLWKIN